MSSRYCVLLFFIVRISSSASGCAILFILPPTIVSFNSFTIFAMVIPSNAI